MKIALIGHGGMGKAVEIIALKRGHDISVIIDPKSKHPKIESGIISEVDVAIDFSLPSCISQNTKAVNEARVPLIIGCTGWYNQMGKIKAMAKNIPVLWSANFSIGVNLYFNIINAASKAINRFEEYDVWGHEIHHSNKGDSPSGSAKTLSEILLNNLDRKTAICEEKLDRKRKDNEIHFSSVRGGPVNFSHTIGFDSEADKIVISHEARSRKGYVLGAVKAAEWLVKQNIGWYDMNDFLDLK